MANKKEAEKREKSAQEDEYEYKLYDLDVTAEERGYVGEDEAEEAEKDSEEK